MDKETQVLEMAKILCPKGTANCEKCSKNYKCDVKFSQLAELFDGGCQIVGDDEIIESMKTYERARQETAREILQELYSTPHEYHENKIVDLAKKHGIELE